MRGNVKKMISLAMTGAVLVSCFTAQVSAAREVADNVVFDASSAAASTETTAVSTAASGTVAAASEKHKFSTFKSWISQIQATNPDAVGWLLVPGTNINTVVVQSPTERNNVYYNERDWKKNHYPNMTYLNYKVTSTFLDYRTLIGESSWRGGSRNTVIYGHNWTNLRDPFDIGNHSEHVMFAQLPSYKSVEFATANPYIYYSTGQYEGVWKVFAAAACEVDLDFFYNSPNPTDESFDLILKEWKLRSDLNFDVDVNTSDRILTLSTCTREYPGQGEDQRYVVVARLLRPGETETDPVTVTVNQNQKKPNFSK